MEEVKVHQEQEKVNKNQSVNNGRRTKRSVPLAIGKPENKVGDKIFLPLFIQVDRSTCGQGIAVEWEELLLNLLHMQLVFLIFLVTDLGCLNTLQDYTRRRSKGEEERIK